jgi:ADP-ribosyl-[dinitrogen reductase] hydrolase
MDQVSRVFASVIGAFIGDAIGAYLEFSKDVTYEMVEKAFKIEGGGPWNVGPGQVTDDSEMAMCLLHSLNCQDKDNLKNLRCGMKYSLNLNEIQKYFGMWFNSSPFDMGSTTYTGL